MAVAQSSGLEVIDERDSEALTTPMTVMDDAGMVRHTDGMYEVTTDSGSEYIVDLDAPTGARCLCPDHKYRGVECKHARRVKFAIGERAIPSWVDHDDVDDQLGAHVASGNPVWSE
ncbi:hypothetical protein [Halostagnicola kamekurae]|uniref:SWIM-type domain-containing protein n=1 Tax=Halostagnicola kamekurae TaxID=619731 RepID=A0A1I6UYC3_9EURY|nr:hypothetical protein [Halostagnicola kamekurae]SFT06403.1 hypothetical protein SAMN04488556_4171 [Halostagnicola kamekurae]